MELEFDNSHSREAIHEAWRSAGVIKLQGFLSSDDTQKLRTLVDYCYGLVERELSSGLDRDLIENFKIWNGIAARPLAAFLRRYEPSTATAWDQLKSTVTTRARDVFGSRWYFCPERSFFRKHLDAKKFVPWHTDADAAEILGRRAFNVWLPLDPVGDAAPSLDFVPGSHRQMINVPCHEGYIRSDEWVMAHFGADHWCPYAKPGDAIIFDQNTLHRTQRDCGSARTSCEFRFEGGTMRQLFVWPARRVLRRLRLS